MRQFITSEIKNQIEFRYNIIRPYDINPYTYGMSIMDQTLPYLLYKEQENLETAEIDKQYYKQEIDYRELGYAISELLLSMGRYKKLSIDKMIRLLGYTKTDIKKLLNSIVDKQYNIVLIGLGGVNSNFVHWVKELQDLTNRRQVFKSINVFENDSYDLTNLPRIPFIPEISEIKTDQSEYTKIDMLPLKYYTIATNFNKFNQYFYEDTIYNIRQHYKYTRHIIIGAPDLHTRNLLYAGNMNFISATHKDNYYNIIVNPEPTNELTIEGYGKIDLFVFFMNMLDMTINILKLLSEKNFNPEIFEETNEYIVRKNVLESVVPTYDSQSYRNRYIKLDGYSVNYYAEDRLF